MDKNEKCKKTRKSKQQYMIDNKLKLMDERHRAPKQKQVR